MAAQRDLAAKRGLGCRPGLSQGQKELVASKAAGREEVGPAVCACVHACVCVFGSRLAQGCRGNEVTAVRRSLRRIS